MTATSTTPGRPHTLRLQTDGDGDGDCAIAQLLEVRRRAFEADRRALSPAEVDSVWSSIEKTLRSRRTTRR